MSYLAVEGDDLAVVWITFDEVSAGESLESTRRRTLSLRFFGADAVYSERPARVGPPIPELHEALSPGDPFRWTDDWFPKVR